MESSNTLSKLLRLVHLVVLVAVAAFLWSDWRARRVDAERWEHLEHTWHGLGRAMAEAEAARPPALATMMDREALAQRVASLVRAATPVPSAAPCQEAEREPAPEPEPKTFGSDEDAKAHEAEQLVSASLASGRLRVQDVLQLRSLEAASKGHPDFAGMRARIIAAINNQHLVADDMAFVAF